MRLDRETFLQIVRHTPLVSVDLLVRDPDGRVLVGLRNNEPAKDCWFVPGGRICKDERIVDAIRRVGVEELGLEPDPAATTFLGVHEHLYAENAGEQPGFGTHYVVLAFSLDVAPAALALDAAQHREYRWRTPEELLADPAVHANTRAYFEPGSGVTRDRPA